MSDDMDVPDIIDVLTMKLLETQQLGSETVLKCLSSHPIEFERNCPLPDPFEGPFQAEQLCCANCQGNTGQTSTKQCHLFTYRKILNCDGKLCFYTYTF